MKKFWKASYKGSYTAEAAFIMIICLFVIFSGMNIAIELYTQVRENSQYSEELRRLSAVDIFWKTTNIEQIWGNLNGDGV